MSDVTTATELDTLTALLEEKFGIEPSTVTADTVLDDLDLDSLALVELFLLVQKRLGVIIKVGDITSEDTVGELARRISEPGR